MPASRRRFLFVAATAGAGAIVSGKGLSQVSSSSPSPSPSPSAEAYADARGMRRFDASLTDEQIALIAAGIEQNNAAGLGIRKKRPLRNGDEPVPEFEAGE